MENITGELDLGRWVLRWKERVENTAASTKEVAF